MSVVGQAKTGQRILRQRIRPRLQHDGLRLPRLASGPYTWFVWPGRGSRNAHRYGPLIGHSTFVVRP